MLGANPLISVTPGLMIWTIVCFFIAFYALKRIAFGPIQKMLDERREQIRRSIGDAEDARDEARKLLEEHRELMNQARSDAEQIRSEIADLTLEATAIVVGKTLDSARDRELITEAIGSLDFSRLEDRK